MLIKAHKDVVNITTDSQMNLDNYMESLKYMSNLYLFINKLNSVINVDDVSFKPSFIGEMTSQKLNILTTEKEMHMKVFKVVSKLFSEDNVVKNVVEALTPLCEHIEICDENQIIFYLI